jgi:hypothetical protein
LELPGLSSDARAGFGVTAIAPPIAASASIMRGRWFFIGSSDRFRDLRLLLKIWDTRRLLRVSGLTQDDAKIV